MPIPEPRESWDPWLEKFYTNPKRWCFTTHSKILLDFANTAYRTIVERSPWSVINVFVRRYFDMNYITEQEYRLLCQLYNLNGWEPDVIIYIKVSPKLCMARIMEKTAPGEEPPVTIHDLEEFERYYENALQYATQPVIRVNGEKNVSEQIQKSLDKLIQQE